MKLLNFNRSRLVDNRWVTILEDTYTLPDGTPCTYYHASQNDAVMAIAIETSGGDLSTYIVNQYRHPIGQNIWQFPLGGFDSTSGHAQDAARAEWSEETGLTVGDVQYMGSFFANPGFSNQKIHVCVTSDIKKISAPQLEATEYGLISKKVSVDDIAGLIDSGEMGDAWGITGMHFLNKYVNQYLSG